MANRVKEIDIPKLCEAVFKSRLSLKVYRDNMVTLVQQSAGANWSEEGSRQTVPLNLISIYQSIMSRKLVAQNPRVLLSTWNKDQKPAVHAMEGWVNREIENMDLADTLRRSTISSLYSLGVTKVGIAMPANAAHKNWNLTVGSPWAEEVLLDDLVFDVHARSFAEVGFIGHRIRVPLDVVKDSKLYTKLRKQLQPEDDPQYNRDGDLRIGVLQRSFYSNREDYEDFIDLWEIYLPRHRLVITLPGAFMDQFQGGGGYMKEPLRVVDWVGPDSGPYHVLSMGTLPGQAMPTAPLQNLKDLHDPVNNILRKLIRQAQRQKEVLPIRDGNTEDGKRIIDANDGDAIRSDNDTPSPVSFGGPNAQNHALFQNLQQLFSWSAGNLDIIGGLSPQSKTLGQDQMLQQNSSALVQSMQDSVVNHARAVIKSLCWYWWYHPTKVMETTYHPPGLPQYSIQRKVHPANNQDPKSIKRSGRLADMEVRVDPYSMQGQTPQSQAAALDQMITQIILPIMPILQQQGTTIDWDYYLTRRGQLLDISDLSQILKTVQPVEQDSQASSPDQGMVQPAQTNRTYTRVSQGNETQGNKADTFSKMMSGTMSPNERNGVHQ